MYGYIIVGHGVHIVIQIIDTLHTTLCYFTLSASFLYLIFLCKPKSTLLANPKILSFITSKTTSATSLLYLFPLGFKGQRSIANSLETLALCVCKPGFAKLKLL